VRDSGDINTNHCRLIDVSGSRASWLSGINVASGPDASRPGHSEQTDRSGKGGMITFRVPAVFAPPPPTTSQRRFQADGGNGGNNGGKGGNALSCRRAPPAARRANERRSDQSSLHDHDACHNHAAGLLISAVGARCQRRSRRQRRHRSTPGHTGIRGARCRHHRRRRRTGGQRRVAAAGRQLRAEQASGSINFGGTTQLERRLGAVRAPGAMPASGRCRTTSGAPSGRRRFRALFAERAPWAA